MVPIRFVCLAVLTGLLLPACSSQLQPRSTYTPPPGASAEEIGEVDTGDLRATAGHEDDQIGAKVIRADEDGDERVIEVEVPVDPDSVDRVQVYTTGPGLGEGSGFGSPVLTREAQIIQNY